MKKKKDNKVVDFLTGLFAVILIGIFAAAIIGLIVVEIYVWVTYGNANVGDIPAWALFFMLRGGQ